MPDAASAAGFAMLCFSAGMAHLFYRSRRRWWQTVLAWTLCFLASGAVEVLLRPIIGSCSGQLAGFTSAFVYLYLFDVPVKQRLFTCFFGNTILYLTVLLSRFTVLLIHGFWSGVRPEIAFVALYVVLTGAAVFLLFRHLRTAILERLAQFEEHLGILTGFAFLGYVLLILLFDAWGGWGRPRRFWAFRNRKESSFVASFSSSVWPPRAMLKPMGNPAKNLALPEFRR